jgi:diacylglycerol kinase (ATP)
MRTRFFLIYNAAAGTARQGAVTDIVQRLEAVGCHVTRSVATTATTARAEAADAARSGAFDALVACGGDGTIRQAAAAAIGTSCPVGAVMLGTGNVLAHELKLPRKPAALVAMLLNGPAPPVELGRANGDPFLLMAGVGFDGRVIGHLDQRLKQNLAKAAYVPAMLKTLAAPLDQLTVGLDGHTHTDVTWAIITKANRYGGAFHLTRQTNLREPGLVAVLFRAGSKPALLRQGWALARGQLDHLATEAGSGVTMQRCEHATVTAARPVPVQIDGDDFGATPLEITSRGDSVRLIVPTPA